MALFGPDLPKGGQKGGPKWAKKGSKRAYFDPFLDPFLDPLFEGPGQKGPIYTAVIVGSGSDLPKGAQKGVPKWAKNGPKWAILGQK